MTYQVKIAHLKDLSKFNCKRTKQTRQFVRKCELCKLSFALARFLASYTRTHNFSNKDSILVADPRKHKIELSAFDSVSRKRNTKQTELVE